MKKVLMILCLLVLSCTNSRLEQEFQTSDKTKQEIKDLKFEGDPESPKDRIDAYESMARAIKYNVSAISQATTDKVFSGSNPKGVLQGIENVGAEIESPLFMGMKALDFALLYTVSTISNDSRYVGEVIYKKSAENLALAAIKSHKGALFAYNKGKAYKKYVSDESKNLKAVNGRLVKKGQLAPDELEYKKGVEVGLAKMTGVQMALVDDLTTYAKLVHVRESEKVRLTGRKFYELEDFDKNYSIEIFQRSAVENRREFQIKSEFGERYNYDDVESKLFRKYPEVERLRINGYDIKSKLYIDGLRKRALSVAYELLDLTSDYLAAKEGTEKREAYKRAMDEVAVAIMTQVELSFNLVQQAEYELSGVSAQIKDIKRVQNELKKRFRLTNEQKVELMDARIKEAELELRRSQIMAERAMAIRATYFYAGLDPFSRDLIKSDIKEIAASLKESFNADMVAMLSQIPERKIKSGSISNEWANEENWLEAIVEGPKPDKKAESKSNSKTSGSTAASAGATSNIIHKPHGLFDPYEGAQYDKLENMQLGSYNIRKSADIEWSYLRDLYPELKKHTPTIEEAIVDGKVFYRMILKSPTGGWVDLCNRMRLDRVECILR
jgi:hypothetical protein